VGRRAGGLLLTAATATRANGRDAAIVAIAALGLWLFWSAYDQLATLSWFYDRAAFAQTTDALPNPDYQLDSLPWQAASPRIFDRRPGEIVLVTDGQSYAYQVFATVGAKRARAADFQFDVDVQAGGVTLGLLQNGKWIASSSSTRTGRFAGSNSTQLGYGRSLTFMIANDNPAGESRLVVHSVRLYLRR